MGFLASRALPAAAIWDLPGRVRSNTAVCRDLWLLDVELPRDVPFLPGQFAMLGFCRSSGLTFRRPFSIMNAEGSCLSFLYRVVGRGTARMAGLRSGDPVDCLAPLGRPFAVPDAATPPVLLIAGGVGLPPLYAWFARHGRPGDLAVFGTRHRDDVPWSLLPHPWQVSVDQPGGIAPPVRSVYRGTVVELAAASLSGAQDPADRLVLACGPAPMLAAAAGLARARRWPCQVSVEEHMGCGYGICKGCVVPLSAPRQDGRGHVNCCTEGPVFDAEDLDWSRFIAGDGEPE